MNMALMCVIRLHSQLGVKCMAVVTSNTVVLLTANCFGSIGSVIANRNSKIRVLHHMYYFHVCL